MKKQEVGMRPWCPACPDQKCRTRSNCNCLQPPECRRRPGHWPEKQTKD